MTAALALACAALPMAAVAVAIRLSMGRPVLFRQIRPGLGERPFTLLKFRTMIDALDADGRPLPDTARLTRLGRFLRRSSLDELPQLWNVLRGEMSLIGPRPLLPRYLPWFTQEERLRFTVRPGITGWAQVNGRNTSSWDERLAMDVWYVRHQSLSLDARILARTLANSIRGTGVATDPSDVMLDLDVERAARDDDGPGASR